MALRAKAVLMEFGTPIAGFRRCLFFGNAIQYGAVSAPITTAIDGKYPEFVEISIHDLGSSISDEAESTIFRSRIRGQVEGPGRHPHLGFGLTTRG
jgi:signal transduction histidine kinase